MTSPNGTTPRIDVSPQDGLLDQPLTVRLHGFAPNQQVTLRARARQDEGATWQSHATFVSVAGGAVDLASQPPIDGTYTTIDPNGLLWSASPATPGAGRSVTDGVSPITVEFTAEVDGTAVATTTILRRAVDPNVTVRQIREDGIVANLFLPAGEGPFPAIVVVGGSGGGFADGGAALYASHGYAALSLAYFNADSLPQELLNIPLEYFESALAWLKTQPELNLDRLAISGTSRGGELALLLASRYPEFKAVVAYVPSGYLWGAVSRLPETDDLNAFPSWTHGGQVLPYVARVSNDAIEPDADGIVSLTPAFLRYLENTERAEAAAIPVERINGPIILISGGSDALWPSSHFSRLIVERLEQNAFPHPYQHLTYEGSGHTIGPRYAPSTVTKGYHNIRKIYINLGGTPSAIAHAREDSWPKVLQFLDEHVKSATPELAFAGTQ